MTRMHSTLRLSAGLPLLVSLLLLVGAALAPLTVRAASLSSLSTSLSTTATPLTPSFDPTVTQYEVSVPFATSSASFRAEATDPTDKIVATWNGGEEFIMQQGVETDVLPLADGSYNELQMIVMHPGSPNVTYFLIVTRSLIVSHNAELLSFAWANAEGQVVADQSTLVAESSNQFSSQIFTYALRLASGVTAVKFAPVIDSFASLRFVVTRFLAGPPEGSVQSVSAPLTLANGAFGPTLSIESGQRTRLDLLVVAEDGYTSRNYSFVLGAHVDPLPAVPEQYTGTQEPVGTDPDLGSNGNGGDGSTGPVQSNPPPKVPADIGDDGAAGALQLSTSFAALATALLAGAVLTAQRAV